MCHETFANLPFTLGLLLSFSLYNTATAPAIYCTLQKCALVLGIALPVAVEKAPYVTFRD